MRLFGTPGSPFARKVRIVLEEKRIPHEYIIERGAAPGSRVPQFNPLGKVPVLALDDGRAIYDSPVIVEYLDAVGTGPRLIRMRWTSDRGQALGGAGDGSRKRRWQFTRRRDRWRNSIRRHDRAAAPQVDRGSPSWRRLGPEVLLRRPFHAADIRGYALGYLEFALPESSGAKRTRACGLAGGWRAAVVQHDNANQKR